MKNQTTNRNHTDFRAPHPAFSKVRVALCGELPTAYDYLLRMGVVHIDKYTDGVNVQERNYDLILIYAPQGEGLMNTWISSVNHEDGGERLIPIRLLNEPCCHSAMVELTSKLRRIVKKKYGENIEESAVRRPVS